MNSQIMILSLTAASLGFIHTLFGPDHYVPFIVLSKARKWNYPKTVWITILCGIGHVGSSVLIGFIGIALGVAVSKLQYLESVRGNLAGWLFIVFGLLYGVWGLKRSLRGHQHTHFHFHKGGVGHEHTHDHQSEHLHPHIEHAEDTNTEITKYKNLTPWILFTIFVFGPCEPLIPLVMFPASQHNMMGVAWVTSVFGLVTILTMTSLVVLMTFGVKFLHFQKLEKYTHALAGATIFLSGLAIQFLGL
ncbi:sulfite exporter TauE/SafE family protein [Parabacteroides sp. FAFU027]|uniref:sulfite exporter TauE/SafE family protein n=1 Tax=Parabacteroides sp. FAFU027 TaxID=2922715 RepID=UPI001FAE9326|nr:sulfite exporter TauE/SafE family protein [Parabacteroides sp. FAFU027]